MTKKKRIHMMKPMSPSTSIFASLIRIQLPNVVVSQMERDSSIPVKSGQTRHSSRSMHKLRMRVRVHTNK